MFYFVLTVHFFISAILCVIVLLQSGRGAELGAAFGGVGQVNSVRTPENFLSRLTTWLAVLFMITSVGLAVLSSEKVSESVIDQVDPVNLQLREESPSETGQGSSR